MSLAVADDERVSERAEYLKQVAKSLIDEEILPEDRVIVFLHHIPAVSQGYFLLNEAYKTWRIKDGHFTQPAKIAALQCMAIGTFQPILPVAPDNARTLAEAKANEIYALACACGVLGISFDLADQEKEDFWLRFLDVLTESYSDTIEPYRTDVRLEIHRDPAEYAFEVQPNDKTRINNLVTAFELMSGKIQVA